ncbi:Signal transduction histidine kinase [Mucilaginibacter mallensis]|uniref:histidine kinase n=1 Tax=Mucilaginibacter mallensis TaxID=652787 RepID=A0A1H1YP03_MUCMA|nr:ATP-binding protein [Mucilaginibacter mallensis]SDT22979.1 Signal transduction histidine kinase [Mucilaginibacter mallensis]
MDSSQMVNNTGTDKYHKPIKDDDKHLNPLYDMKEVPKRTYQLGIAALLIGIGLSFYDAGIGLYVSSFLVACFCFATLMFILLKYNEAIENLPITIIILICGMIISATLFEGLDTDQYLYFFPILIAVPIIVNLKRTRYRESGIYIAIILFSFCVTIVAGRYINHLEHLTAAQISKLVLFNRIVAISSTILFAIAYTFFEEKYIRELMEQSKRVVDSRTRFLATMGHELRTPLNGIIGVINLLKQEHSIAQQDEYIQVLKYCSDHMLQQINNILDFNKIEANKLEIHPVSLNLKQLMQNVSMPFTSLYQEKGIELKTEIGPGLDVIVLVDDLRLIQVFNNLFSNALKFTEKGYVKLKATMKSSSKTAAVVSFSVEDTGIGIAKEDQKQIFEGFWQVYNGNTKTLHGTGLGLNICMRLLKLMNSSLNLTSEKGKGSIFSFDLKLDYVQHKSSSVTNTESEDNLAGTRVLLVEDNQINMMVAKKVLINYKALVSGVFNGKEALDALEKDAAYDVILLDLEMPVMNGYIAIYEIKKMYPQIPVIAFTASVVDQEMLTNLIASGFSDCITKPFQPYQLLSIIKKYIKKAVAVQ